MKTQVVRIHAHGSADVLRLESIDLPEPGPGEVRLRQLGIGLNFADIYQRSGAEGPHGEAMFPVILGVESAGVVEALGTEVKGIERGQIVACLHPGAYASHRNVPAARVIALPPALPAQSAAAYTLRGLTARYLVRKLHQPGPGQTVLIHAAGGGLGSLLSQWCRGLGARVIGTIGSEEKRAFALSSGCHTVINYCSEPFVQEVLALTQGQGVDVVYDGVGKDVFFASLDTLRPMGMAINFGTASGPVRAFDLQVLHEKSLRVCRPTLRTFIASHVDLAASAADFFEAATTGVLRLDPPRTYALEDAARAHSQLESRQTSGASVLVP